MKQQRLLTTAHLARIANVSQEAAWEIAKKKWACATVDGKINVDHAVVKQWLAQHKVFKVSDKIIRECASLEYERRLNEIDDEKQGGTAELSGDSLADISDTVNVISSYPENCQMEFGDYTLQDLKNFTLHRIIMRYGSLPEFKSAVEAGRHISEYNYRQIKIEQERGELIDRSFIDAAIFSLVNTAFSRLVSDVPMTLATKIIARVESGGDDLNVDVQNLIREANSSTLKSVKDGIEKHLGKIPEEGEEGE